MCPAATECPQCSGHVWLGGPCSQRETQSTLRPVLGCTDGGTGVARQAVHLLVAILNFFCQVGKQNRLTTYIEIAADSLSRSCRARWNGWWKTLRTVWPSRFSPIVDNERIEETYPMHLT